MAYATLADLATYTGKQSVGPGDERLLQRASELVDRALKTAYYLTDSAGNATDAVVIAALRDAVCAQVEWFRATDDSIGRSGSYQTTHVQPATLVSAAAPGRATGRLAPVAWEILGSTKGILWHKVYGW